MLKSLDDAAKLSPIIADAQNARLLTPNGSGYAAPAILTGILAAAPIFIAAAPLFIGPTNACDVATTAAIYKGPTTNRKQ